VRPWVPVDSAAVLKDLMPLLKEDVKADLKCIVVWRCRLTL